LKIKKGVEMNVILKSYVFLICFLFSTAFTQDLKKVEITFTPISHASFVIQSSDKTIFVDPVGDIAMYSSFSPPDIILITHAHGDHLSKEIVNSVKVEKTVIVAPKAVVDQLQYGEILKNGDKKIFAGVMIEAIPMYNLTEGRLNFHKKGQGNGYVVTLKEKRIYISGDTEDIIEMRKLTNIDYAFICMNLPYTMTVEQAASAVLEMKPKVVYPYHYRGTDGFSDIEKFKELVSENKDIEVRLLEWYN
jgi:L-ascorbate metabolism protein UlaG (beta-lactamase superfamily)